MSSPARIPRLSSSEHVFLGAHCWRRMRTNKHTPRGARNTEEPLARLRLRPDPLTATPRARPPGPACPVRSRPRTSGPAGPAAPSPPRTRKRSRTKRRRSRTWGNRAGARGCGRRVAPGGRARGTRRRGTRAARTGATAATGGAEGAVVPVLVDRPAARETAARGERAPGEASHRSTASATARRSSGPTSSPTIG